MALSYTDHVGDGVTKNFALTFSYIARDHIHATVDGAEVGFSWLDANTLTLTPAPAGGAYVRVYRKTPGGVLLVDFQDGSTLTESDLDLSALQTFYIAQEATDAAADAGAASAAAVEDATEALRVATDAHALGETAVSTANSASGRADTAIATAGSASDTASAAKLTAQQALTSAGAAVTTANAADGKASTALSTATTAKTASDSATTTANAASTTAGSADSKATTALSKAASAESKADGAVTTANAANTTASQAMTVARAAEQAASVHVAADLPYDNNNSGLLANDVQEAIDLIAGATGVTEVTSDLVVNASNVAGAKVSDALDALKVQGDAAAQTLADLSTDDVLYVKPDTQGWNGPTVTDALAHAYAALAQCIPSASKGAPEGVATLDSAGKVRVGQLPAIALVDTFVVASQAAMLALDAQRGDVAVRSDLRKSFILQAEPVSALGNWVELQTPTDAVLSVNGYQGAVVLGKSDVGLGLVDNTPDTAKPISTAAQAALDKKEPRGAVAGVRQLVGADTLILADAGLIIECAATADITLTIPLNSLTAFPVNTRIDLVQYGAGALTIVPASGVTLCAAGGRVKTAGQFSAASLWKRATDEWVLFGDLTA